MTNIKVVMADILDYDECYWCDRKTKNCCPFCGNPYCEECFEKNELQCPNCTTTGYE